MLFNWEIKLKVDIMQGPLVNSWFLPNTAGPVVVVHTQLCSFHKGGYFPDLVVLLLLPYSLSSVASV